MLQEKNELILKTLVFFFAGFPTDCGVFVAFMDKVRPGRYLKLYSSFAISETNLWKSEDSVKLLGIQLDYELNFDPHILVLCRKAATQLNVPKRLRAYIGFDARKVLVQSLFYSNFNYCPLAWQFLFSKINA